MEPRASESTGDRVRRGRLAFLAAACLPLVGAACTLDEATLAAPEDVVVAEALVQVGVIGDRITVFLHRTLDAAGRAGAVPGARIRLTTGRGTLDFNEESDIQQCVTGLFPADQLGGTCYSADPFSGPGVFGGDSLRLEIELPDGRRLTSSGRVPDDFELLVPAASTTGVGDTCSIAPRDPFPATWSRADGSSSYIIEATIEGLPEIRDDGRLVDFNPLFLIGLSVSDADTTVSVPDELGVFDRFDLPRDLSLLLQEGLPEGTTTTLIVGAIDRNYVNWVRGGNFNPSGAVRIPSVRGDGTGFLGSVVRRSHVIVAENQPFNHSPCLP